MKPQVTHSTLPAYDLQRNELIYLPAEVFLTHCSTPISMQIIVSHHTRAIITRSRFETALDYKPRIFKVRKVSLNYKPLCSTNRGLYNYQKLKNSNSNCCHKSFSFSINLQHLFYFLHNIKSRIAMMCKLLYYTTIHEHDF